MRGFRLPVSGCRLPVPGFRLPVPDSRVAGAGSRRPVSRCGFRVVSRGLLTAAALVAIHVGGAARGQEAPVRLATPFLPAGHWSHDAARKLDGLGAAPRGFDAGVRALRIAEAVWVFETAARADDAGIARLARGYLERIGEEFGSWLAALEWIRSSSPPPSSPAVRDSLGGSQDRVQGAAAPPGALIANGAVGAGYVRRDGWLLAGIGYDPAEWQTPVPDEDVDAARGDVFLTAGAPRSLAIGAMPFMRGDQAELGETHVVAQLGKVGVWGGRRALGYGVSPGGGVVLSDRVTLDGGGIFITEPILLPGFLRALGPIRAEMVLSRLENGDVITDPWFWGSRITLQPHARLDIGLNRGAMFGGKGGSQITLEYLLFTFVGAHSGDERGEFANQILSLDVRYRPPVGRLPLVAWLEWGMDDTSGGWYRSPAIFAGIELAGVPGAEAVSIGVERASFAAHSHKNPLWYRNLTMRGGWTHERRPLGHPLAGHGTEWRVYGSADALEARLRVRADVRLRDRGEENLYAPTRTGSSTAAALHAEWRAAHWLDLGLIAEIERAAEWRASSWSTSARVLF